VHAFVQDYDIKKLNFAGPRGSGEPQAYHYTKQVVSDLFRLRDKKEMFTELY